MPTRPLRILEIAGSLSARSAARILAAMGADVVRVEPVRGDSFGGSAPAEVDPATAAYFDSGKRSIAIDITRAAGAAALVELTKHADALIEDLGPHILEALELAPGRLLSSNANLAIVRISPFGHEGPRASWAATELTIQAMGGVTQATGYSGEPPFRLPGFPAHYIAGLNAALAVAGAVLGAESGTESGAEIHISMEHAYMHHWVRHIQQWACSGHDLPREPRGEGRQGFPHTVRAADGWIYLLALYTDWESLAAFLELDQFATSEWGNPGTREGRWEEIEPHFNRAIERRPRYQWLADAAEYGYTFAPVHEMSELASSPQAEAREAFTPFEWDGTKLLTPSLPFKEQNGEAGSRYVPRKGEHTLEVLTEWGLEKTHVAKLIGDGLAGEGAEANLQRRRS